MQRKRKNYEKKSEISKFNSAESPRNALWLSEIIQNYANLQSYVDVGHALKLQLFANLKKSCGHYTGGKRKAADYSNVKVIQRHLQSINNELQVIVMRDSRFEKRALVSRWRMYSYNSISKQNSKKLQTY